jgi:general secretion pathway protein L
MAHSVIGLDCGSYEVKAVVIKMAIRGSEVARVESEPVLPGDDGRTSRSRVFEAAGRLMARIAAEDQTVHCVVPGDIASVRQIGLPIGAARRIEPVLKFQLDEILPFDIEDAVFDFVEIGRDAQEVSVLTGTVMGDQLQGIIHDLQEQGVAPREIGVATLAYLQGLKADPAAAEKISAVVDIGHQRTNIAILDAGRPSARSVLRGGADITVKLMEAGNVDFEKAQAYKHQYGLTGKPGEVIKAALGPLVREINQTLTGHLAAGGGRVSRILLAGGSGLMEGLDTYLADEIGVPVERYYAPVRGAKSSVKALETSSFVLAHALASREEVPRAKRIDLRKGDYAFQGDFEFLRRRAGWIAACIGAIFLAWIFSTFMEFKSLEMVADARRADLTEATKSLFGKVLLDTDLIKEELESKQADVLPIPKKDAFDVVVELSRRIPISVVHDIELLDIKSKRVTIKGEVDPELKILNKPIAKKPIGDAGVGAGGKQDKTTKAEDDAAADLSPTDLIKQKLEGFKECFGAIRVGKVSTVGNKRRYQMEIESRCP